MTSLRKFLSSINCRVSLQATSRSGLHTSSMETSSRAGTVCSIHSMVRLCSSRTPFVTLTCARKYGSNIHKLPGSAWYHQCDLLTSMSSSLGLMTRTIRLAVLVTGTSSNCTIALAEKGAITTAAGSRPSTRFFCFKRDGVTVIYNENSHSD